MKHMSFLTQNRKMYTLYFVSVSLCWMNKKYSQFWPEVLWDYNCTWNKARQLWPVFSVVSLKKPVVFLVQSDHWVLEACLSAFSLNKEQWETRARRWATHQVDAISPQCSILQNMTSFYLTPISIDSLIIRPQNGLCFILSKIRLLQWSFDFSCFVLL